MHRAWFRAIIATLLVSVAAPAAAADQILLGSVFLAKDPIPPDTVRRYVKVAIKEAGGGHTVVGDPTVGGATLRLIANGGSPSDQTFNLPASGWVKRTSLSGAVHLRYRDKGINGAVKQAEVRTLTSGPGVISIKVLASGKYGTLNVVPPNPGTDAALVLAIAGGDTYCSGFGGAAGGILRNEPPGNPFKLFAVKGPTAEIGACPP
jgi:hypothetical protein